MGKQGKGLAVSGDNWEEEGGMETGSRRHGEAV